MDRGYTHIKNQQKIIILINSCLMYNMENSFIYNTTRGIIRDNCDRACLESSFQRKLSFVGYWY